MRRFISVLVDWIPLVLLIRVLATFLRHKLFIVPNMNLNVGQILSLYSVIKANENKLQSGVRFSPLQRKNFDLPYTQECLKARITKIVFSPQKMKISKH